MGNMLKQNFSCKICFVMIKQTNYVNCKKKKRNKNKLKCNP